MKTRVTTKSHSDREDIVGRANQTTEKPLGLVEGPINDRETFRVSGRANETTGKPLRLGEGQSNDSETFS